MLSEVYLCLVEFAEHWYIANSATEILRL